jgi:hypothetical protein
MKLIIYTLNSDGTVPDYVIDGGYWPFENNKISPQDFDLVGVATESAPQEGFANEAALLTYGNTKSFSLLDPITQEPIPVEILAAELWAKLP